MKIVVLGTPEHEGRMLGSVFDILCTTPVFLLDELPLIEEEIDADVIIVSREWSRTIRLTVARARRRGIPVVYVMDGVIEWSYVWNNLSYVQPEGTVLQPLLASSLCVIGRHPARILAALGHGAVMHVVGLPRLDGFSRARTVDAGRKPIIVVATPRTAGHNTEQRVMIRRALRDLKEWFSQQAAATVCWRISAELALELGVEHQSDEDPVEMLRSASGLISFTSTLLLEGQLLGLPTAQIDYRSVPQYVETAWSIRCKEHIPGVVQELLYPTPDKLAYQQTCLHDELECGDAAARLATVIRGARASMLTSAEPGQTHNGALDYRQVHSHLSAFAVSPLSVLQYELDAASKLVDLLGSDVVRLHGVLEQSQAERASLRARLDQAETELQQAELMRSEVARLQTEVVAARSALATLADRHSSQGVSERLRRHRDAMVALASRMRRSGVRRAFIYGAGEVGEALLMACRECGIDVRSVIDSDARLWGLMMDGVRVVPLESCLDARSPVFGIGSIAHATDIRTAIRTAFGRGRRPRVFGVHLNR